MCYIFKNGRQNRTCIRVNPHTEIISFVSAFFYSDMFYKGKVGRCL